MKAIKVMTKILNGMIDGSLIALFVLFLLVGVYIVTDTFYIYSGASQRNTLVYKPGEKDGNAGKLRELSKDCIGWITVDGTGIDYPLMKGRSNSEYLNTDPFGEYALSGSIFLDCRNAKDLSDGYSVIYGHHMEGGALFGALDRYLRKDFFESHRTGRITLTDGTVREFTVFAVLFCNARDTEIFDPGTGKPSMDYISAHAEILSEPGSGRIVSMTTCFGPGNEDRLAVLAELSE